MRDGTRICVLAALMAALPLSCGGDDDTSGGSGGSAGQGATGGSSGSAGNAGASTGGAAGGGAGGTGGGAAGAAGSGTGGGAGAGTGGAAGSGTGGAAGGAGADAGVNGISADCKTCLTQSCASQFTACIANATCNSCVNLDYQNAACKGETHYKALCACGVSGGGPCHNQCGTYCAGTN